MPSGVIGYDEKINRRIIFTRVGKVFKVPWQLPKIADQNSDTFLFYVLKGFHY